MHKHGNTADTWEANFPYDASAQLASFRITSSGVHAGHGLHYYGCLGCKLAALLL